MTSLVPYSPQMPAQTAPWTPPYASEPISVRRLLGVLLNRARLALAVAAVIFLSVFLFMAAQPRQYEATASLMIQPQRQNMARASEPGAQLLPPDTGAIDSQVEVLRSPALARAVVERMRLYADPEFVRGARRGAAPSEQTLARVTAALQRRLHVRRVGLTSMVVVGAISTEPAKAQRIANTVAQLYLERDVAAKLDAVSRARRELSANLDRLRLEAVNSQAALQEYRNAHNLLTTQGASVAEVEISNIDQQVAAAQADRAERQARLAAARNQLHDGSNGADVGAALASDTVRELRRQEAEASTHLADLNTRFTAEYPEVIRERARVGELRSQIQSEINRIMSNLGAEAQASAGREGALIASRSRAAGGLAANNRASVGLVALQQRADAARGTYEAYLARANQVDVEGSIQQADAVLSSLAALPVNPFAPNKRLAAVLAFALALLGGIATVLVAEFWERKLRSRDDVEQTLGAPFAGIVPDFASTAQRRLLQRRQNPAEQLVRSPMSGYAEAFRGLRAFLLLNNTDVRGNIIGITSALPGEGKSLSALCLARTMAMSGSRTILVDCDPRRRGVTCQLGGAERGLSEVLQGKLPLDEALIRDDATQLMVLPCGPRGETHDMFATPALDNLLQALSKRFDYVILDTQPVLGVAGARLTTAKCDRVLFLTRWNQTSTQAAQSAMDLLRDAGVNVVGAVLTRVDVRRQSLYGYGDSSDYYQYFGNYYLPPAR
jgi:succinoglycan biosynthesis transport protein ExoP